MSLPAILGVGQFSIYGIGSNIGVSGIVAPTGFLFSTIYNIWNGDNVSPLKVSVGDSVMYKEEDICKLAWDNGIWGLGYLDKIKIIEITGR